MRELEIGGRCLHIEEEWAWHNEAGAVVWDAALVLSHYIAVHQELVRGRRVLELGSGPGAVGCTAAALGASTVAVTDLQPVVALAARNIQANGLSHIASAVPLPWGQPLPPPEQLPGQPFDLVLASDVLYFADALPLFISTLSEVFSANPEALLVLCNEHRPALPFPGALFAAAGLSVCRVPTAEQHPDWRSDDIHLYHIQLANLQASQRPARGSGTGSP
ncbi:hypothetical protein ABPG77_008466 [Micractinium sp. CCAP 211/92]